MSETPNPISLINAWLAVEALQPQTFPAQERLFPEDAPRKKRGEKVRPAARFLCPFDISKGEMPWDGAEGDRERLGVEKDEAIRWFIPLAFVNMKPAVEMLVKDVEPEGPERERAEGVSILALAPFNEKGFPAPSKLLLSSFGWACGEILAGRIGELHQFFDVHDDLCREIGGALVELDPDGTQIPTSKKGLVNAMTMLMRVLKLPHNILERPRFAIRTIGDAEKDPIEIINSFYIRDLYRVKKSVKADQGEVALNAYLAITQPKNRENLLEDKASLEELIAPIKFPLARWPAQSPAKLVTLQQAAVIAAIGKLKKGGILSVNGPPGTGKTTLLRDVVAAVISERADVMVGFDDPEQAFVRVDMVGEGGRQQNVYRLAPGLRRHGMVVASSNNSAVRNVSEELPRIGAIARESNLRYFSAVADQVQGKEGGCWGLIAAVLGNKSNRSEFVEAAWWNNEWGIEKYLAAVTGRAGKDSAEEPPPIVVAENPPINRKEAKERWVRARLDYREKRSVVEHLRAAREKIRVALLNAAEIQQAAERADVQYAEALKRVGEAEITLQASVTALEKAECSILDARRLVDGNRDLKPGILGQILGHMAKWRAQQEVALDILRHAMQNRDLSEQECRAAEARILAAKAEAEASKASLMAARRELKRLAKLEQLAKEIYQEGSVGPSFWSASHAQIHTASPWADDAFNDARDALFASAMRLHKAFIDAAAYRLKSNLGLFMNHLKGKRIPSGANVYLEDLWDTFFLFIPLVSTTFASFDRLMDGMGPRSIGWLIVDESGQAPPQDAVGAIWRAERALVIGDPLQLEPVTTVPEGLVRAIFSAHEAHPDVWAAPRASVQTLADSASSLMATVGNGPDKREIGIPLLVHRRCQNPMFSISNEIAYDNLMVHAVGAATSTIGDALSKWLPGSCWIDVQSNSPKWSPQEGEAVIALLNTLAQQGVVTPNIYVISPFREVADKVRSLVVKSGVLKSLKIPPQEQFGWGKVHIGTVHTFQGKEAEAVIIVLGAPGDGSQGSRNWAGQSPNILNVAASRAKQALYIIGRHDAWKDAGVFGAASVRKLPVVNWPCFEGVPKGEADLENDFELDLTDLD